ncbi:MAG TPA: pantoate--beta-alanine ligase [Kosmotogaceae bacterium]|nr:pantoate--beta-alanine ligase [Kosmotogaceae bacterium]
MNIIRDVQKMKEYSLELRLRRETIGFVPTMGYLHRGHLELVKRALAENDVTVVSIFVNPTQFGPGEDFDTYPRDEARDLQLLEELGVDCVFVPSEHEIYPEGYSTYVHVERLTDYLCGAKRPGHFRGVATVVTKLFNIVSPEKAYFGQKDAQQFRVLRRMVLDLNMSVTMVEIPTVREEDGLAMSSRNRYLSKSERKEALLIREALDRGLQMIKEGTYSVSEIRDELGRILRKGKHVFVDYIEIVDEKNLNPVERLDNDVILAIAVFVGKTRLIDNEVIRVRE